MNRHAHALLAPLFAVLALLLGLSESASAAFNHAAQNPHYGNFLLWESEVSGLHPSATPESTRDFAGDYYDFASGRPPWTKFDPLGLWETDSYWGDVGQVFVGYGRAIKGTAVGLGTMVAHPVQTAKGISSAVASPIQTGKAIMADYESKLQTNAGVGEIVGEILIGVATGGAAKAASETATVSKLATKLQKLTGKLDDATDIGGGSLTKSASQIVEENNVRIRHATSNEGADKIMDEKKIDSSSKYVYGQEADKSGSAPTKKELLDTGAASADKVIEFDAKPSEYRKNEVGDVEIPKPVDLTDRNPRVIDVEE